MGYHLRLTKGLSYCGVVSATKGKPDVFTDDEATADAAVASGYFTLIDGNAPDIMPPAEGHLDKTQLKSMTVDNLKKLAAAMELDVSKCKNKEDYVNAIAAVEVNIADVKPLEELAELTVEELTAYAKETGIDLGDLTEKEDILEAISVANGGSYTILDLMRQ